MKWSLAVVAVLLASPAFAADDCGTYTSDMWEPGERTVTFANDGSVVITDETEGAKRYNSAGIGTGIPGRALIPVDGHADEGKTYIEHKGDMIIDNEVFEPYCGAK